MKQKKAQASSATSTASRAPEIRPEQSLDLLKALHILTRDGAMNQDSRRKLKQVYHLVQFIEPLLREAQARNPNPVLVDHGAGKSYLGFILYDLFTKQQAGGQVIGVETRAPLIDGARALATQLGFARMAFVNVPVVEAATSSQIPQQVDVVTALHACNTATDDAIQFALAKQAQHVVVVPCCQAEVASFLRLNKSSSNSQSVLSELWRHPLHTREFGSQITNVLRCLRLEASGYQVTVTELVGWEHSMKNELIIASKVNASHAQKTAQAATRRARAHDRLNAMLGELQLSSLSERFAPAP
jgi:hypothetical protein